MRDKTWGTKPDAQHEKGGCPRDQEFWEKARSVKLEGCHRHLEQYWGNICGVFLKGCRPLRWQSLQILLGQ
jgi:hypothetical protein